MSTWSWEGREEERGECFGMGRVVRGQDHGLSGGAVRVGPTHSGPTHFGNSSVLRLRSLAKDKPLLSPSSAAGVPVLVLDTLEHRKASLPTHSL